MPGVIVTPQERAWSCTAPLGARAFVFPPPRAETGHHFVAFAVDTEARMDPSESCTRDDFPSKGLVMSVFPPGTGRAVGFHIGELGSWWPTDPSMRGHCANGGFIDRGGGRFDQVRVGVSSGT